MALSAAWDDASLPPPASGGRGERLRAFQLARRHSRLVRRLRILLPAAGALAVLVLAVVTHFALPEEIDLSVARLSVTPNSIIMDNPHLTGFDADDRHYSVQADRAIQALTSPNQVRLEVIQATVTMAGRGTAAITAAAGDYDNTGSTLRLHGGIAIDSSDGYRLRMNDADIDFSAGTMASANPVSIGYQDSRTVGDSLEITGSGELIVLEGGVRTLIMPPKRDAAAAGSGE
jgi:lipopolysaccharide export system protein LptC